MVAQSALEVPFASYHGENPLVIPAHERQKVDIHRDKVRIGHLGGRATFAARIPEHATTNVWKLLVGGYTAPGWAYEPEADAFAQLGVPTVTVNVNRGMVALDLLTPWNMLNAERYEQEAYSRVMDEVQQVHGDDLLFAEDGHSMGGRTALGLAEQQPERIVGLKLVSAAGLESHNLKMMVAERLPDFVRGEFMARFDILCEVFDNDVALILDYLWQNGSNLVRTIVKGISIGGADIRGRVKLMHGHEAKVSILDVASDDLIPNKDVAREMGVHVDHAGVHPNTAIGHLGPQTHAYEMAYESNRIDRVVDPERFFAPREFSVVAMTRTVTKRSRDNLYVPPYSEAS